MSEKLLSSVVIVDDSEDHRYLARRAVQQAQLAHEVLECPDAEAAITVLTAARFTSQLPPTLLLVDVNMPRMGGFELLDALWLRFAWRHGARPLIVVIYSSSGHASDVERAMKHPLVDAYIVKPPVAYTLRELVQAQLNSSHWHQSRPLA